MAQPRAPNPQMAREAGSGTPGGGNSDGPSNELRQSEVGMQKNVLGDDGPDKCSGVGIFNLGIGSQNCAVELGCGLVD